MSPESNITSIVCHNTYSNQVASICGISSFRDSKIALKIKVKRRQILILLGLTTGLRITTIGDVNFWSAFSQFIADRLTATYIGTRPGRRQKTIAASLNTC